MIKKHWSPEAIVDVMLERSKDLLRYPDHDRNRKMLEGLVDEAQRQLKQPEIPAPAPPKPKGPKGGGGQPPPPGFGM